MMPGRKNRMRRPSGNCAREGSTKVPELSDTVTVVVPRPSGVARSTSKRERRSERLGTMKTSLYVRSYGGGVSLRNLMTV